MAEAIKNKLYWQPGSSQFETPNVQVLPEYGTVYSQTPINTYEDLVSVAKKKLEQYKSITDIGKTRQDQGIISYGTTGYAGAGGDTLLSKISSGTATPEELHQVLTYGMSNVDPSILESIKALQSGTQTASKYVVDPVTGNMTLQSSLDEQAKNEAAVAAGTMKKVQIGNGWGYVPTGSAADLSNQGKTQEQILASPTVQAQIKNQGLNPVSPQQVKPQNQGNQMSNVATNYKIVAGDTLSGIAQKNGTTVQALMQANPQISDPNKIYAGQSLVIPGQGGQNGQGGQSGGTSGTGTGGTGTDISNGSTDQTGNQTGNQPAGTQKTFTDTYKEALKSAGVSDIKTQFDNAVKQHTDLTNEMNDKIASVNENPWMSQSVRDREVKRIQDRYETRLNTLTNEQKLYDSMYQQGLAEAKFLATGEAEQQQFLLNYAQQAEEAKNKLQQQAIDNKDKALKIVSGGIYDTDTNSWVVMPKETGSGDGGLSTAQMNTTINGIANSFDNEPLVKDYNQATSQYQLMDSLGTGGSSPGDDIAFVYAFAKIMDPNSVVREGEYATVQKYAQSFLDAKTLEAIRLAKNTNFLTPDAKQKLLTAAKAKMTVLDTQYKNVYNQYQNRINNVQSGGFNTITDYSQAFGNNNDPLGLNTP